ncbi:MAG: type II toxin-antitoxin system RelE/ParE family toxin [Crocosphaera sp.]|nr:type II toxin-antitoxin system RelE/ParE family toxin [Crocosphaera sp.]
MNFEFHPQAKQELEDAVNYYDSISQALGDQFILEIQKTLERIEKFPEAWLPLSKNTRKCRVLTFPYGVIY